MKFKQHFIILCASFFIFYLAILTQLYHIESKKIKIYNSDCFKDCEKELKKCVKGCQKEFRKREQGKSKEKSDCIDNCKQKKLQDCKGVCRKDNDKILEALKEITKTCDDQMLDCVKNCSANMEIPQCLKICKQVKDECEQGIKGEEEEEIEEEIVEDDQVKELPNYSSSSIPKENLKSTEDL